MQVLFLGNGFDPKVLTTDAANAKVAIFHNRQGVKDLGTISVPDQGSCSDAFLREMLAQTRAARLRWFTPLKPETTDVRFDRVFFRNGPRFDRIACRRVVWHSCGWLIERQKRIFRA